MNRKDTILVAVLINAGVLVVLFTSALKNKTPHHEIAKQEVSSIQVETPVENVAIMKDEIDLVIEQLKLEQAQKKQEMDAIAQVSNLEPEIKHEPSIEKHIVSHVEVTVAKGDFLAKIAKKHQVSVEDIMKANNLKNTNLRIGQVLKVPQTVAMAKEIAPQVTPKQEPSGFKTYTIKPGDNPWTIAQKHKMKVDELLKLNGLSSEKAKQLKVGDKLKVKA